jgi:LuxR family maltose regulon positive regulatory protein
VTLVHSQLLRTKLYIPPVHPQLVPRPRLTARLDEGVRLGRKLTLVSAPAGYGKTTLLSEWVASSGGAVAWLSLDKDDNTPSRFWTYVIAALQTVDAGLGGAAGAALAASQPRPRSIQAVLTGLINEIDEFEGSLTLILDDYHAITTPDIHDGVAFLLGHQPSQMHLVIAARADPPWPLARLRARGEMTELRLDDLVFTPDEIESFLRLTARLDLPRDQLATLGARTEGWVAGLQMAALSMQGRSREGTTAFVHSFAGSHRFILDYLMEEVLDRQTVDIHAFLLNTSILERMTAPLCDALTGREDSQAALLQLEQANLFLIPLDDTRHWYRYHHLFTELLRSRLQRTRSDLIPALHRRASLWLEQNGLIAEAVSHALAAGDLQEAQRLVRGNVLAMMDRNELGTLAGWLDMLPAGEVRMHPWLSLALAWTRVYAGPLDAVEPLLRDAEETLSDFGDRPAHARHIRGHIATIRAYAAVLLGAGSQVEAFARSALADLPTSDLLARGVALAVLATALRDQGDFDAAEDTLVEAVAVSRGTRNNHVTVTNLCDLAELQTARGKLRQAAATCRQALRLAYDDSEPGRGRLPVAGLACTSLSHVLREWNELESAVRYAQEGVQLAEAWGWAEIVVKAYIALAQARQATGDAAGALRAIAQAQAAASELGPEYSAGLAALEARIHLSAGDLAAAARWAARYERGSTTAGEPPLTRLARHLLRARILIAQSKPGQAADLLTWLLEEVEQSGVARLRLQASLLQSIVLQERGEQEAASAALACALSLAEPEGYVRTFITAGPTMGQLLRQAIVRGIAVPYATRLLAALQEEGGLRGAMVPTPTIDPLSKRELEVLRLLTTHLSSVEIAHELTISSNTVRTHIKNIYGKMGVHSRSEAVGKAEELKLL